MCLEGGEVSLSLVERQHNEIINFMETVDNGKSRQGPGALRVVCLFLGVCKHNNCPMMIKKVLHVTFLKICVLNDLIK